MKTIEVKAKLPVLDNAKSMEEHTNERMIYANKNEIEAKGLASIKQKRDLILLLAHQCVTEEEKEKMIRNINKISTERAEEAIWNLQHRIKQHRVDYH